MTQTDSKLSPIKRALQAVDTMQTKLEAMVYAQKEPIAVVGMGCRFPGGASSPDAFWELLQQGKDAIVDVPANRWDAAAYYDPDPQTPGKIYIREAGFLDQIDRFDAQFFGISAREAASLDPQQRLLLEVAWEALEQGNQASDRLFNSKTGVFAGICSNDYNKMIWDAGGAAAIDAFCATGNALSVAAGRLSHWLGLKGPSLAVDTACSSALVAVHLACQSLRSQECNLALAGGVHLLLSPDSSVAFSRTQMLDPSGRCKTFDAKASGYSRGEGCGVVVLKRLSDAEKDRDSILAVIRGSAVSHNGRSSSLVAPNGPAQQAVIRQALAAAEVLPDQVDYVEVHGTGTATGQPIEVGAIATVFCSDRPRDRPLVIGSVKTNLGHLEGASGMASLIKTILSMQHQEIPPHLHMEQPNPHIDWDNIPLQVPTQTVPWSTRSQPRLAGINCFGFSGTNAHVVLAEAPEAEKLPSRVKAQPGQERPLHVLTLSAKTEAALRALADQYLPFLRQDLHQDDPRASQRPPQRTIADICFSANTGRSHFPHRLSLVGETKAAITQKLTAFVNNSSNPEIVAGKASAPPKVAFLFPHQAHAYKGMGQTLMQTQPVFKAAMERCDAISKPLLSDPSSADTVQPLIETVMTGNLSNETAIGRAAIFSIEYSLYQLWKTWGVEPVCLLAAGVGQWVAACAAGVFDPTAALTHIIQPEQSPTKLAKPRYPIRSSRTSQPLSEAILNADYWRRASQQQVEQSVVDNAPSLTVPEADIVLVLGVAPDPATSTRQKLQWLMSLRPQQPWQTILTSLGQLYVQGCPINWRGFDKGYARRFVHLPTYAWQRQHYWIDTVERPTQSTMPITFLNPSELIDKIRADSTFSEIEQQTLPKLLNWINQQVSSPHLSPVSGAEQRQNISQDISKESSGPATNGKSSGRNNGHHNRSSTTTATVLTSPKTISESDIRTWLIARIASELGIAESELDPSEPFDIYGLDSVLAIGIASAGKQAFGIEVTPLMLMHYPSIDRLSRHLATALETAETEIFEI